jgi:hypothetical protein
MPKFKAQDIDWTQCEIKSITSHGSNLPPNIKAFKATHLDSNVIKAAIDACKGSVQVAHIEVPADDFLKQEAEKVAKRLARTEDIETTDYAPDAEPHLRNKLLRLNLDEQPSNIIRSYVEMLRAVPADYQTITAMLLGRSISHRQSFNFDVGSTFNEKPSWYLRRSFTKHGSVFIDARHLDKSSFARDCKEPVFNTKTPMLWQADGFACTIETAGNHQQGSAASSPPITNEPCMTTAFQFNRI